MQAAAVATLSHNLNGQRLGRKGRDTRERILGVTKELVATADHSQISLSAIARGAGMGMTSLYVYFSDLTEVLLAVLAPVMAEAEDAYIHQIREHWADDTLYDDCLAFVTAFHAFWQRHSKILHLRNTMADQKDKRMVAERIASARIVMWLLVEQMGHDPNAHGTAAVAMATVLYTGIERVITIATDTTLGPGMPSSFTPDVAHFIECEARLLELGIREYRGMAG
ncbi:MAG: TetR/AcrR family transcriptional regulator [Alphaproteobacteria bacterium]|nr:TetR/AcrR family transcriptional regulator [Alphaproteobacteria bacterium]